MKTLLKLAAGIVGLVVVVLVGAGLYLKFFVDTASLQARIAGQVEQRTGRSFALEGESELSVFPWLGVRLDGLQLGNAPGFGDEPMIRTGAVQVRVRVLPLLTGRVEMGKLVLQDVHLALAVDAEGRNNWQMGEAAAAAAPAEAEADAEAPGDASALADLSLGGIDIRNANLSYSDARSGERYALSDLGLETGAVRAGEPVQVSLKTAFDAAGQDAAGDLGLKGELEYDLAAGRYSFRGMQLDIVIARSPTGTHGTVRLGGELLAELSGDSPRVQLSALTVDGDLEALRPGIDATLKLGGDVEFGDQLLRLRGLDASATFTGESLPEGRAEARLSGAIDYDPGAGKVQLDAVRFDGLGARLEADMSAEGLTGRAPTASGEMRLEATDLRPLMLLAGQEALAQTVKSVSAHAVLSDSQGSVRLDPLHAEAVVENPALGKGPVGLSLDARGTADLASDTLSLETLKLEGLGLDLQATLNATAFRDPAARRFQGSLALAPFSPRALMTQLGLVPPATTDPAVLQRLALKGTLTGSGQALALTGLELDLDDTRVSGRVGVSDLQTGALDFDLAANAIDLDRYLPPPAKGEPAAAPPSGETGPDAPAELPLETLRALALGGELRVGDLKIKGLEITDIYLKLDAHDGRVQLEPASAKLYQGAYKGSVVLDASGSTATLALEQAVNGIQAEPLLTDLAGKAPLSGRGDFTLQATAKGNDSQALVGSLNGKGRLDFRDGAIRGINIGRVLRQAGAGLTGAVAKQESTDYSELTASFTLSNGVLDNRDLSLKSPLFRISGQGTASLPEQSVDYEIDTTVVATAAGQGGQELEALSGLTIPIRVTGTFDNLSWKPDLTGVIAQKAAEEIKKGEEKIKQKAGELIEEQLGKGLPGQAGEAVKKLLNF